MFTTEHDFDATTITLVDEGAKPLREDVIINAFDDCATLEQFDPRLGVTVHITLSTNQLRDLAAAMNLPEGAYVREATT